MERGYPTSQEPAYAAERPLEQQQLRGGEQPQQPQQPWGAPQQQPLGQHEQSPWGVPPQTLQQQRQDHHQQQQQQQQPPPTHTIPYAASGVSVVPASRAMGAPPSMVMGGTVSGDPTEALERINRARSLLQSTRSVAEERYAREHASATERGMLRPTISIAEMPAEAVVPDQWLQSAAAPVPQGLAIQAPEREQAPAAPVETLALGAASDVVGATPGATSMGVSQEGGAGMAGAGTGHEWMDWVGKPKPKMKVAGKSAGDRTDDQWVKLSNGVLQFYKDPYHNTVRTSSKRTSSKRQFPCARPMHAVGTDNIACISCVDRSRGKVSTCGRSVRSAGQA